MNFRIGEYVTRKSHNNDIVFQILSINDNTVFLKGIDVRLVADSDINDLEKTVSNSDTYKNDRELTQNLVNSISLDRAEYFYLPGRILHIDSDSNYLERCIKFYSELKVEAYGEKIDEDNLEKEINSKL